MKCKVGELVLDFGVYPRMDVDAQHVTYMKEAFASGVKFPLIVIDAKSKRVVDGFHRTRMYLQTKGADYEVEVVEKTYRNDGELFLDAMRYNAHHGRSLSRYDRAHCMLIAEKLELDESQTASALGMTLEKAGELKIERTGKLHIPGKRGTEPIPLKRTIRHMRGRTLTPEQQQANERLSGMNQVFYVNQLILLIENGLLEDDADLFKRLKHLGGLIQKLKVPAA